LKKLEILSTGPYVKEILIALILIHVYQKIMVIVAKNGFMDVHHVIHLEIVLNVLIINV
jgi:hypothetical protein